MNDQTIENVQEWLSQQPDRSVRVRMQCGAFIVHLREYVPERGQTVTVSRGCDVELDSAFEEALAAPARPC